MTLGAFVKRLVALLQSERIIMPFENEAPWHELFYKLKREHKFRGRPAFFDSLRFDWDGPFPKSQELSDFLHALHWNACVSAQNPKYDRFTVSHEIVQEWLSAAKAEAENESEDFFFQHVKELAREAFPQSPPLELVC